jgi:hypothetical protein
MSVEQRGHRLDWLAHTPMHSNCDISLVHIQLAQHRQTAQATEPPAEQSNNATL